MKIKNLKYLAALAATMGYGQHSQKPNIVFVFADQWRAQATGYAGDPNVKTPNLDQLSRVAVNLCNAVSCCPVSSPYRGSLLTGQYPLTHGLFVNDVPLDSNATTIAKVMKNAGYQTAYIGKWHVDGHGRSSFIPKTRHQGFDYWRVLECTHDYNQSFYYGDTPEKKMWKGYDAFDQTDTAITYIKEHKNKPFVLFLSWGSPHSPYETAPQKYRDMYKPQDMILRPNVLDYRAEDAKKTLAGYYAHCTALDDCIGKLISSLKEMGIYNNTIFVFTSDHGDMLGSKGLWDKEVPFDEAIRVPFLLSYPEAKVNGLREVPINSADIMPTLLGLCNIKIPSTVEGKDFTNYIKGGAAPDSVAFLCFPIPFHNWNYKMGGREYRGIRTSRYTYVRSLEVPWLLYDNLNDPFQLDNLVSKVLFADVLSKCESLLNLKLKERHDEFLKGEEYVKKWGYNIQDLKLW